MTKKEYMELVDRELTSIKKIIEAKNHDYTGGSDDPFENFKMTETMGFGTAEQGLMIRLMDKIQRIKSFMFKGELKVTNESATDAARDMIGYTLILIGLMEDKCRKS
jgi:hypothetical protein